MSDWPASAEAVRAAQDDLRWHTAGSGEFVLITRAWIPRDGALSQFECVHRFETMKMRDEYRSVAEASGLRVEVAE